eukprot:g30686.t1
MPCVCQVVSVQYPAFSNPLDWCKGFDRFLDEIKCRAVHVVGAGLGGFLAQHFASKYAVRVKSLVLCNSFASTYAFESRAGTWGSLIPVMPATFLRQAMQDTLPQGGFMELSAKQAIDWVGQQMNDLSGDDLASRLSLNCSGSHTMVPDELRRQLKLMYQGACFAELKSRGIPEDLPASQREEDVFVPHVDVPVRREVWKNPFEEIAMNAQGLGAGYHDNTWQWQDPSWGWEEGYWDSSWSALLGLHHWKMKMKQKPKKPKPKMRKKLKKPKPRRNRWNPTWRR